ncbi:carbamoyl-phosphate synthase domain-containing protein [Methanolobus sp.]|jgi:carbamoyl-phosphate synthase small subunit|uniref:carbamoyl-phosphate synthase domain-containing protein n=1 Tax=Methanolobus sp. TaxID=1874737 RepID=UPI0025D6C6A4|nr:carbamoyl-phosphate synthase domain-containing protein [Methanolobus sp.]
MKKAILVLEDGTTIFGKGFGAVGETYGELVFNTAMTGYVESLTDPSYTGQILMSTYPLVGNYGVCNEDYESDSIKASGFVVKELCRTPSNWRSQMDLDTFMKKNGTPGIEGVDTRIVAGTNPYINGSPYSEFIQPELSTGRRIANEIKKARDMGCLDRVLT